MTKDKNYYHYKKTEYRNLSGKRCKSTPGQFRLEHIDADLKEIIVRARKSNEEAEEKKPSCTPEQAKGYWKAFQKFLEFSGSFTRTWHLYSQIKDDSDVSYLSGQLSRRDLSEVEKAEYDDRLRRALNHQDSMKIQGCDNLDELSMKASKDWQEYRKTFNRLLECSKEVGFSFELNEDEKDAIMLHFVILDDKVRGNCRREFYKERYVTKAIKAIEKTGFFQPVSIEVIEKAFQADKTYQKLYYRKRRK